MIWKTQHFWISAWLLAGFCTTTTVVFADGGKSGLEAAKARFVRKIETVRWVTYTPIAFNPAAKESMLRAELEADLKAIKAAGFTGLITYSCSSAKSAEGEPPRKDAAGFADIPVIAKKLGFEGFIAGVWEPDNEQEIASVKKLARESLIDAVCVGNEGLDVRYDWKKLSEVMQSLRQSAGVPVTTTEEIGDYGMDELRAADEVDWLFPNIHPAFQNERDPTKAAEWTVYMASKLREASGRKNGLPLLVKETGWPSRGLDYHSQASQKQFWDDFKRLADLANIRYAIFEAFDQPWKHENLLGKDIGGAWGVFTVKREPKLVLASRNPASTASDEVGQRIHVYLDHGNSMTFIPSGWMPDGKGISQNTRETDAPHSKKHCIHVDCQFQENTWAGVYFLLDGQWEPKRPFNLFDELLAKKGDAIKCRFWTRSKKGATVQFKVGGVTNGDIKDSVVFPRATKWVELKPEWTMHELDLTGQDVSSLVGAFSWIVDRRHNEEAMVSFDLDTIYFVKVKSRK